MMSGRGADRGSAGRGAKRKAPRESIATRPTEIFLEGVGPSAPSDLDELYVDDKPRKPKRNGAEGAPSKSAAGNGGHAAKGANGHDAARASAPRSPSSPSSSAKKKAHRAAERRRARGNVPIGPEAGTSTALNQRGVPGLSTGGETGQLPHAVGVLKCVKGPEEGLALNLLEGSYTVGRGRDNSFVLKDIAASRRHLRIDVENGRVSVTDLGSGNGTRVNNKSVTRAELDEGDRIELGNSVLVYSHLGPKPARASSVNGADDDAKARIERAAEKLAAELGDRFRDGDGAEGGPDGALTSKGLPRARGKRDEEPNRKRPRPPMPEELWNDGLTHVPLSDVVPADAPLGQKEESGAPLLPKGARGEPRRSKTPGATPRVPTSPSVGLATANLDVEPPASVPAPPPAAPPRSAPVPLPPPPPVTMVPTAAPVGTYDASSDRRAAPAWTYVVLPALVVVLVLGAALGVWAIYRAVRDSGSPSSAAAANAEYEQTVRLAFEAFRDKNLDVALVHAQRAFELRPNEVTVVALLQSIQDAKAQAAAAPAPPPPREAVEEQAPAKAAEAPPAPPPPVEEPAKAAPVEVAPAAAPPRAPPVVETKPPPPPPRVVERPPVVRQKPKPRPRVEQRRGMTDGEAGDLYRQAVRMIREDAEAKGCAIMRRVANDAPAGSNWKAKAQNALGRYGCD